MLNKLKNIYPFREIARVIDLHFAKMESLAQQVDEVRQQTNDLRSALRGEFEHTRADVESLQARMADRAAALAALMHANAERTLQYQAQNGREIRKLAASIAVLIAEVRTAPGGTADRAAGEMKSILEKMLDENSRFAEDRAANDVALLDGMAALVDILRDRLREPNESESANQT